MPFTYSRSSFLYLYYSAVAFATPPLFHALRGGTYFIIAGFVIISTCLVLFVYRETAHKTLEELAEVFGETAFVNAGEVMVPDPTEARMSMHMSHGARSMSTNRSGRARSMSMVRSGTAPISMDGAMSRIGTIGSPPQTIPEVVEGIPDMGLRVVDEKGANSALTSRTTVAMQDDRKKDV